ncbi:hypothetical protein GB931_08495 [Modestobacter sp. I12A-02628]|uniref:Uncharacterized protein n=1 Tax=Goekera deserti TaxID=2497753 RepID=A0A7K3WF04_9ACTN|nr:hypothetical protein [Goekera deserti]MPQ97961.1 hypothetical protein [Goekera deserti]NDI48607.1 hypothetical protein [Goekera deserti]NEL55014.1 hypothetical protein [Goekera deserti]
MRVHVVYRYYAGENMKDRPAGYSKTLCLQSFLRAVESADVDVTFLTDGPATSTDRPLMESVGTVVQLPGVGMRGSYLAALRYATSGRWPDEDFVLFSEDDYLFRPDALVKLTRAVEALPDVDYLALYGGPPNPEVTTDNALNARVPAGWRTLPPWEVDGDRWVQIDNTTSSFGGRVGALTEDMGVFRFCMVPHKNMLRDHDTGLLLQGYEPYPYAPLVKAMVGLAPGDRRERVRSAVLAPFYLATNLRAHRRASRRRLFLAASPNLATHMETGLMAAGTDWAAVAEDVRRWAAPRPVGDPAAVEPPVRPGARAGG